MTARDFLPPKHDLTDLAQAAMSCTGCELHATATQTVFGTGPANARMVLVGEQPGDVEDRRGKPFLGPAGIVLNQALAEAAIDRADTYVTNAVKHFRFSPVGKRRLHQTPKPAQVEACQPWLWAELSQIKPVVVVALGATAVRALLGTGYQITRDRGQALPMTTPVATQAVITTHPSAILRMSDDDRPSAMAALVRDLRAAAALLK